MFKHELMKQKNLQKQKPVLLLPQHVKRSAVKKIS